MIAQKLKYYRAIQRLTQRDLAECSGLGPSVIGQLEARNKDVTLSVALKVAKALEVRVEQLTGELTETQRDEIYLANQRVREARERKRLTQRRLQRQRREERAKL